MTAPSPSGRLQNPDLLGVYCNDHLASSTGGVELVRRMLSEHRDTELAGPLEQLLGELRDEQTALTAMMRSLGLPVRRYKQAVFWIGEKLARAKLNGRLVARSPLSDLIEFEVMASAVRTKRSGFETLREAAEVDPRLPAAELDRLIAQANRQYDWLTRVRREVAAGVFGGRPEAAGQSAD